MGFDNIRQIPPNYHEGDNKLRLLPSVFAELRAKLQVESQSFQSVPTLLTYSHHEGGVVVEGRLVAG